MTDNTETNTINTIDTPKRQMLRVTGILCIVFAGLEFLLVQLATLIPFLGVIVTSGAAIPFPMLLVNTLCGIAAGIFAILFYKRADKAKTFLVIGIVYFVLGLVTLTITFHWASIFALILPVFYVIGADADKDTIKYIWGEYGIIIFTVVFFIVCGLVAPRFLTSQNILLVMRQTAIIGIIALGMTFVIITGGIDLSSGHLIAMAGTILLILQGNENISMWVAILACFGVATGMGFINGVIITKLRLPAFIVTLAVGIIARSLTLFITDGVTVGGRMTPEFLNIGNGGIGPANFIIPYSAIVWILMAVILGCVLAYTKFGAYTYAVGGNEVTAKNSGINTDAVKIAAYTLTGFCVGVSALFNFSRVAAILPATAGNMFEFDAITAVVIGGAALAGGRGKILGTFFGMLIIGVVSNLLVMFQISPFLTGFFKGTLILVAVLLQRRDRTA